MNNLLIVGTFMDGPDNLIYRPQTSEELTKFFKSDFRERHSLTNTATSQALLFNPFSLLTAYGSSFANNTLYGVEASGSIAVFGVKGGDTESVDFRYTPYLGTSDIVTAGKTAQNMTGSYPWLARIQGVVATGTLNNWIFKAKYSGTIYNNIDITYSSGALTIEGVEPRFPKLTYTYVDNADLEQRINQDYSLGVCPVYVKTIGDNFSSSGTVTLSGGTNGSLDAESINNFLLNTSIPHQISHIVFLTEATSGIIDALADRLETNTYQPRMYYLAAPSASSLNAYDYCTHLASALPQRHNMVSLIHGTTDINYSEAIKTRYLVEPAMIQAANLSPYSLTYMPLNIKNFEPSLNAQDLGLLFNQGVMAPVRSISEGPVIFKAVSSTAQDGFIVNYVRAEIWARMYALAKPYLNTVMEIGSKPEIATLMRNALSTIPGIRIISATAFVQKNFTTPDMETQGLPYINLGYVLDLDVAVEIAEEILEINFTVRIA